MKKTLLIVFGFIAFIISVAFTTLDPPGYKNLKILPKDISKQALDSIMHFYSASLGEKCGFCHVHNEETKTWDMANDAKSEKLIARRMMLMVNGINKMYFPPDKDAPADQQTIQTVTCYTCHKGQEIPADKPEVKKDFLEVKKDSINTK
jgi:Photosynthetic reaction centre cytochrome C subunit.